RALLITGRRDAKLGGKTLHKRHVRIALRQHGSSEPRLPPAFTAAADFRSANRPADLAIPSASAPVPVASEIMSRPNGLQFRTSALPASWHRGAAAPNR